MDNYLPVVESDRMNEYARLTVERHALLREMPEDVEEDGGTEQLWRIEDKMAIRWQRLDEAERQAVSGLASDLAWVRRKGELAPKSHLLADVSLKHAKLLIRSLSDTQVYEALHYVRVCRPLTGKHLSAVWRSSLYRTAFQGVASEVFARFAGDIFPQIVEPYLLPVSYDWQDTIKRLSKYPWPFLFPAWKEMRDEMYQHQVPKFPQGDEAFRQPILANRLAALMLETMPWPLSMMYLYAAVTYFPAEAGEDLAE